MITSHSQSNESHLPAYRPIVREPQEEENLYDTFLEMRDLLEANAPAWYFDELRKRVEAAVQPKDK